mmetsp:Transcript_3613/g.7918  ORF Transcript_3613/g.7918 Transcript_3613/m.7918 type:complete len:243 (-) Transcript_3613:615-1343(-)
MMLLAVQRQHSLLHDLVLLSTHRHGKCQRFSAKLTCLLSAKRCLPAFPCLTEGLHSVTQLWKVSCAAHTACSRNKVCVLLEQHEKTLVHLRLEMLKRQIIGIIPERILEFYTYEVQRGKSENRDEAEHRCPQPTCSQRDYQKWRHEDIQEQHHANHLCIRKWKTSISNLLRGEEVHKSTRQGLVHSGQDRGRHFDGPIFKALRNERLDEMQQHFHHVEFLDVVTLLQVHQRRAVQTISVDGF